MWCLRWNWPRAISGTEVGCNLVRKLNPYWCEMTTTPVLWLEAGTGTSREAVKAIDGAHKLGYSVGWGSIAYSENAVPVGSVGFCEKLLGYSPRPDFYPMFLAEWMHRIWLIQDDWSESHFRFFVKSAERYKAFPSKIINPGEAFPSGKIIVAEVVTFIQEWRYYVADGCVLATGWYDGEDEDEPAPELNIDWPKGFCGAVDFGRLSNGMIALVESHHPYACGWYGDDSAAFAMWLVEGWRYMRSLSL